MLLAFLYSINLTSWCSEWHSRIHILSSPPRTTCPQVGGQAVIEGVMMRSPNSFAVACRAPSGHIVVRESPWEPISNKLRFLKVPFLRGSLVLAESLHNGMSALSFSANVASVEAEPSSTSETSPNDNSKKELNPGPQPQAETGNCIPAKEAEYAREENKGSKLAIAITMVFSLFFAFALFKGLPHVVALGIGKLFNIPMDEGRSLIFHVVDGTVKLTIFVLYLVLISRMKEIKRVFRYHGAEHKTIFAHEAGVLNTPSDAARFSCFHPRCGTAFLLVVILVSLLVYMAVFPLMPTISSTPWVNQSIYLLIKLLLLFPIAGIAYEVIRFSGKRQNNPIMRIITWPGLTMQRLTALEPSEDMLEIATVALKKVLWREAQIASIADITSNNNSSSRVTIEEFPDIHAALNAYSTEAGTMTMTTADSTLTDKATTSHHLAKDAETGARTTPPYPSSVLTPNH